MSIPVLPDLPLVPDYELRPEDFSADCLTWDYAVKAWRNAVVDTMLPYIQEQADTARASAAAAFLPDAIGPGDANRFVRVNGAGDGFTFFNGGSLVSIAGLTTVQGDILYLTAPDTYARLPKGIAGQLLKMNAGATAPEWKTAAGIIGPVAASSGSAIDFSSLPSGITRAALLYDDVSLSGTDEFLVQLGTGGVPTTSGYVSGSGQAGSGSGGGDRRTSTSGLVVHNNSEWSGAVLLQRTSGNKWVSWHSGYAGGSGEGAAGGGKINLAEAWDFLRVTSTAGSTFTTGELALAYWMEG